MHYAVTYVRRQWLRWGSSGVIREIGSWTEAIWGYPRTAHLGGRAAARTSVPRFSSTVQLSTAAVRRPRWQTSNRGDTIVFATDRLKVGFVRVLASTLPAQSATDRTLAEYGDTCDDELVLGEGYLGET